ncbi:MAG TPA: hypothetical protein VJ652_06540 [Noviherbaspirillum sp.]|nr:hypothetical protein [Noviherbaspirillum sp.]
MCYRIPAGAEKDVSKLSSVKESVFTPREDIVSSEAGAAMSESGMAGMFHKLLAPFSNDKGGIWHKDDMEMTSSADTREVEKID